MIITIDGPSGSGKSTIAKLIAKNNDITYIDSGSIYRAIAYFLFNNNIDITNEELISEALRDINLDYTKNGVLLNGRAIDSELRTPEISQLASKIAVYNYVRNKVNETIINFSRNNDIIAEGRDMGSTVLPTAKYKFYLDASPEIRAQRRYKQLKELNIDADLNNIYNDIIERDYRDSNRSISPLVIPKNSIIINSDRMTIDEVIKKIISYISEE